MADERGKEETGQEIKQEEYQYQKQMMPYRR